MSSDMVGFAVEKPGLRFFIWKVLIPKVLYASIADSPDAGLARNMALIVSYFSGQSKSPANCLAMILCTATISSSRSSRVQEANVTLGLFLGALVKSALGMFVGSRTLVNDMVDVN